MFDSGGVTAQRPPRHQQRDDERLLCTPATAPSPSPSLLPGLADTHSLPLLLLPLLLLPETPTNFPSTHKPLMAGQPHPQPVPPPWQRSDQGSSSRAQSPGSACSCTASPSCPTVVGGTPQTHKAKGLPARGALPAHGTAVPGLWSSPWHYLLSTKLLTTKTRGPENEPRSLCKYILLKITVLGRNHTAGRRTQQRDIPLPMIPAHLPLFNSKGTPAPKIIAAAYLHLFYLLKR